MTVDIRTLHTSAPGFDAELQRVLHWSAQTDAAIEQRVAEIIDDVRLRGDAAVLDCTAAWPAAPPAVGAATGAGRASPDNAARSVAATTELP